ncbi:MULTISPECIES: hypothetical protein [Bacillus]|nr:MULTISPECIES: hypothetical protein [Bacillus cereus group]EOP52919.1 hypothetical protein IIW_02093 [Bacillus cereus VD136]EOP68551.1 hypothetical protein KOW_03760 [Bacillus cereus VDM006]EOQ05203.1 hypothetical protein KOY_02989 [Bacillus cereus VDM021]OOG91911.1 hypothetical protein BTH41_01019 [Bacillus mycoides]MDF2086393.1 hypothetical protein [Bacillus pseudomycoides]
MHEVIEEVVAGLCEFVVEVAGEVVTSIFTDWNTEEEKEEKDIL